MEWSHAFVSNRDPNLYPKRQFTGERLRKQEKPKVQVSTGAGHWDPYRNPAGSPLLVSALLPPGVGWHQRASRGTLCARHRAENLHESFNPHDSPKRQVLR